MKSQLKKMAAEVLLQKKGKRILSIYIFIGFIAPFLAGKNPLVLIVNHKLYFPAFSNEAYISISKDGIPQRYTAIDWRMQQATVCVLPPVPYDPGQLDPLNTNFTSPFQNQYELAADGTKKPISWRYRHWLGTTRTGQDVLSVLIHGCRTSLLIGFFATALAAIIALFTGLFAGYYGNHQLRCSNSALIAGTISTLTALFYSHQILSCFNFNSPSREILFLLLLPILFFVSKQIIVFALQTFINKEKHITIPADKLLTTLTSGFLALPRLVLILSLAAFWSPSILSLILIIGLTSWAEPARVIRTEMLRLRSLPFMEQAKSYGAKDMHVLYRHALPNLSATVQVIFLTGVATAILTEAGLTFLGIGLPFDTPSWGALLFEAKRNIQAWWLVVVPGYILFLLTRTLFVLAKK